jgi:hypothetical protein
MNRKRTILLTTAVLALALGSVAPAALAGKPVVHGIVSQGYLKSSEYNFLNQSKDGSFQFNEVMLNVSAKVTPQLRVGAQLMARNLGVAGNEDFVLDWAFGDYRVNDYLGIRVGKVKTPYGFYNKTRDVDMVRNSILLPQAIYTESLRDVVNGFEGFSVYGNLNIGSSASFEYEAFLGTVDTDRAGFARTLTWTRFNRNITERFFGTATLFPTYDDREEVKDFRGFAGIINTPLEGLRVGGTILATEVTYDCLVTAPDPIGSFTPTTTIDIHSIYVLSAEYTRDRMMLAAEYMRADVDLMTKDEDLMIPYNHPVFGPIEVPFDFASEDLRGGWYLQGTYQATDRVQLGGYYSKYYPNYTKREAVADEFDFYQDDIAFTVRYDINDYWLIKAELHLMKGVGNTEWILNNVYSNAEAATAFPEESWNMFGIKSTFFF